MHSYVRVDRCARGGSLTVAARLGRARRAGGHKLPHHPKRRQHDIGKQVEGIEEALQKVIEHEA
jgi:hypothetical protein